MKKIVCELCESTEFAKEGGMFVCQSCGTKYTPEEAKAMMKEVEGDASPTPVVGGDPSVNPNQQQIDNLLVLASNAFESSNNQEAEGYCNKVIELDVTCYKAWLLKGQAIVWQSTYSNPRIMEGANAMHKAVDFAPEEEKENVAKEALRAIENICIAGYSLAKDNFANNPTENNRNKFEEFHSIYFDTVSSFLDVSKEIFLPAITDGLSKQDRKMAEYMNLAGVAALEMVREKWNSINYPNHESWNTYIGWIGEIERLFKSSIIWGEAGGEDDANIITRHQNLIIALEEPIDSCSYTQKWSSYSNSYMYVKEYTLTDNAKTVRKELIQESKDAIKKIENKEKEKEAAEKKAAEEAKIARIKAYWEAHKEEKEKLQSEGKELLAKQNEINAQISDLDKQIKAAEAEEKAKTPSEAEEDKLNEQVRELNNRRANLGIFAGKEKKQISEEIAALEGRISAVKEKVQAEKKAKSDEIKKKVAPLKSKKDELNKELPAIAKRLKAIDAELSKDPEE